MCSLTAKIYILTNMPTPSIQSSVARKIPKKYAITNHVHTHRTHTHRCHLHTAEPLCTPKSMHGTMLTRPEHPYERHTTHLIHIISVIFHHSFSFPQQQSKKPKILDRSPVKRVTRKQLDDIIFLPICRVLFGCFIGIAIVVDGANSFDSFFFVQ